MKLLPMIMLLLGMPLAAQTGGWTLESAAAPWAARSGHSTVVFNSRVWVIGGKDGGTYYNDVWSSADGVNWTLETSGAAFSARERHTSVVFSGKIWVLGGTDSSIVSGYYNDVWSSADGVNWTQVTSAAGWAARAGHASVVHDGKIWVLGGYHGSSTSGNDVWYTSDGASWTHAGNAGWYARSEHAAATFDGKMYISGGTVIGKSTGMAIPGVWASQDGVTWTLESLAGTVRSYHRMLEHAGRLWIVGGFGTNAYLKDVWSSTDGASWTQDTTTAAWSARGSHTCASFDGRLWLFGGYDHNACQDVWSRDAAPTITSTPPANVTAGNPYTYTVDVSGSPTPTVSALNLPAWLSLNGNTISGTPGTADVGTTPTITVSATNPHGTADQPFTIHVLGTAPAFTSSPPTTAPVGTPFEYIVVAVGSPAPQLQAGTLPAWLALTGNILAGTPPLADIGTTVQVTLEATNSNGHDTQDFQLQLTGQAPQFTSAAPVFAVVGQPYQYSVSAVGYPAPQLGASGLPGWLSFDATSGVLAGTPTATDEGTSLPITLTASNGWGTDAAQVFHVEVSSQIKQGGGGSNSGGCAAGSSALPFCLLLLVSRRRRRA